MEPKHGRVKTTKTKTMSRLEMQKTTASKDASNGRQVAKSKPKGSKAVFAPIAPPRLTSRKGGAPVKTGMSKQQPKR